MTPTSTPGSRARETAAFFEQSLAAHFRAEETALFPALRAHLPRDAPEQRLLEELVADHRHLEALRDALVSARSDDDRERVLATLAAVLERHVRREERDLFVRLAELTRDEDERTRIGLAIRTCLGREV
jgi:hemerythrin superfamily protein